MDHGSLGDLNGRIFRLAPDSGRR